MNPLEDVSMLAVGTMLVYITLSVFTILNVVTGVFVNTAPSWLRQFFFCCVVHLYSSQQHQHRAQASP